MDKYQQRKWQWSSKLRYKEPLEDPPPPKATKISTYVQPQLQSRLFQIPPELRDIIYAKIFGDVTIRYNENCNDQDVPSGIVLACELCYMECKEHYFKSSTLRFEGVRFGAGSLGYMPPEEVDRYRYIEVECYESEFVDVEDHMIDERAYDFIHLKPYNLLDEEDRKVLEVRRARLAEWFQRKLAKNGVKVNPLCKLKIVAVDWDECRS